MQTTLHAIQEKGAKAGVVLNPATPLAMVENVLEFVDYVLIMSVNPGYGGQSFIPNALAKIKALDRIRREQRFRFLIEIDGGVSKENVQEIVRSGCDWLVAGSSVFHSGDPAAAVKELQHLATEAFAVQV